MNSDISMTNVGFDVLGKSAKLLNLILDNISSYVLLLDRNMRLKAYNDSLKTIFSKRKGEDLLQIKCGEAIGCAHQIEEKKL